MNAADDFKAIKQALDQIEADKKSQLEKKPVDEPQPYIFATDYDPLAIPCGLTVEARPVEDWLGWPPGTVSQA